MTIKPWLSKNFLHQMRWSNVRDYPPKKKKPWLFDNFMDMEETHSDHSDGEIPGSPLADGDLPLPPPPDIPQDPEEPDPCLGDRDLWVVANPSTIDCDVSSSLVLLISPDFRCIELTQPFIDPDGPKFVDDNGDDLSSPTNVDDIVGDLHLSLGETCDNPSPISLWVSDCLCGGSSSVNISFDNCGVTCGSQSISGQSSISPNFQYQYTLVNAGGEVTWSLSGPSTGISINATGLVTTASNACGSFRIRTDDSCCGTVIRTIFVNVGIWQESNVCDTGVGGTGGFCDVQGFYPDSYTRYWDTTCFVIDSCGDAPCNPTKCPPSSAFYPNSATARRAQYDYICPP